MHVGIDPQTKLNQNRVRRANLINPGKIAEVRREQLFDGHGTGGRLIQAIERVEDE